MSDKSEVLIASRSEEGLGQLKNAVSSMAGIHVEALLMTNGHHDPLAGLTHRPDVLILHADGETDSLQAIARRPEPERPALLIVAKDPQPETVKHAVRAGARDFLGEDEPRKLVRSLEELLLEMTAGGESVGDVTSIINAKGGSGGTFITCNLGHITAQNSSGSVLVLDLDFQFASLPHYFDLTPKRSFLDALANAPDLDRVAVEAYVTEHSSGVGIMAPDPDSITSADFDITERIRTLLPILRSRYDHIFVDVPRHIDEVSSPILRASDNVLIVLQQSLPSVRDAVRLKTTLVRELAIEKDRISVVVNRHLKTSTIGIDDICDALGEQKVLQIPNHYKSVAQSIDFGVPIAEYSPSSPVVRALGRIQGRLFGETVEAKPAFPVNQAVNRLKQWSPF
jgi:pilus assembly protein CpaE